MHPVAHIVGEVSLNLSLLLYIVFYLPQLIHNFLHKKISEMSMGFHALLFIAATADLYYGFGRIVQWQYRLVSAIMFICLVIQHFHLFSYLRKHGRHQLGSFYSLSALVIVMLIILPFSLYHQSQWMVVFIAMGWLERFCYWFYSVPQMLKNRRLSSADSMSLIFISIALITAVCDTISAWVFHWGPSSLYGAPIAIGLSALFLIQYLILRSKSRRMSAELTVFH